MTLALAGAVAYLLNDNKTMIRVVMHNIKDGRVWLQPLVGTKIAASAASAASEGAAE